MDPLPRLRSRPILLISACTVVAALAVAADRARAATVLELTTRTPAFTAVDLDPPGTSRGDVYAFSATVLDGAGTPRGTLVGTQVSIAAGPEAESVLGAMTLDLDDGQLAIGGSSAVTLDHRGLVTDAPFDRAVLGGTGRYAGARGTLTSTRRADGAYTQRLVLLGPATRGATTLDVTVPTGTGTTIDTGEPGPSPGDVRVLSAPVLDAAGRALGTLRGTQTDVLVTEQTRTAQAQLTYALRRGDIVVGGVSARATADRGLVAGAAVTRPVLGGTGAYAGTAGTLTTRRDGDVYREHFALVPGGRSTPARTVEAIAANDAPTWLDLGPAGHSPGDLTVFDADLASPLGAPIGRVRGTQMTVGIDGDRQTMSSSLIYDVRGRGQLVVGGVAPYPSAAPDGLVKATRVTRAVLGGTGEFAGAHGVQRAVRRADGTYRLTFSLLGAPSRKR